jgi:hypothetical protein
MRTRKVALGLYITASFIAVLATMLGNDVLLILSKPVVIPAILFYYLAIKRQQPVSILFLAVLILNFIGDSIVLLELDDQTTIIMIPYFIAYVILLKFAIEDVRKLKFYTSGLLLSAFVFFFLMYIMYALIQLFIDTNRELVIPVIIYGIVLSVFGSVAAYCFYIKNSTFTFYLLMAALLSIVSDVFYMVFSFIFHFQAFNYFEFAVQMISYFFIVKYFVLRKNS